MGGGFGTGSSTRKEEGLRAPLDDRGLARPEVRSVMFTGPRSSSVLLLAVSFPATEQWLNYPTPGILRLPDGKPDLAAPALRKPDGKPDLSGIWHGGPQSAKSLGNTNRGADEGAQ